MGIFRDIKLFFSYSSLIKKNKVDLQSKFNIRIDSADRMYTVLNLPTSLFEEPYNLRKADIDSIAETSIKEYVSHLSTYLNSIGISELYDFYEPIKKVDKYSYLIILGYKNLDSVEINKILYRFILPIVSIIIIICSVIFFIKQI